MNTIELWLWRVTDPVSHRCYVTRYRMTDADALDLDPAADRVPGSQELRQLPTDPMARRLWTDADPVPPWEWRRNRSERRQVGQRQSGISPPRP